MMKNIKVGDLLYLKTYEEVLESKHVQSVGSLGTVNFDATSEGMYSPFIHSKDSGKLVTVTGIYKDLIAYDYIKFHLSSHAFRKPTEKELEDYEAKKR